MRCGAIMDGPVRRPGVFEPRSAASALPQSAGGTNPSSTDFQNDRVGNGWPLKISDVRQHQSRIRQEGTAAAGTGSDVLYDVEATVLQPQGWERGSPPDVLVSQNRRYALGSRSRWLPGVCASIFSRADHRIHHFGIQVVRRNGTHELASNGRRWLLTGVTSYFTHVGLPRFASYPKAKGLRF